MIGPSQSGENAIHQLHTLESKALRLSFFFSVVCLALILSAGNTEPNTINVLGNSESNSPIEAQLYEKKAEEKHEPRLRAKSVVKPLEPLAHEATLSRNADVGVKASVSSPDTASNVLAQADSGPSNRGPSVLESPAPRLPDYLRDQNLKTSVLIEFEILSDGRTSATLLGSSGNEELDALALRAAQKWRFTPALVDAKPVASKIRLKINFTVN